MTGQMLSGAYLNAFVWRCLTDSYSKYLSNAHDVAITGCIIVVNIGNSGKQDIKLSPRDPMGCGWVRSFS